MTWPPPLRSVRARIATQYSLALFGVTALLIVAVNIALGQIMPSPQVVSTTIITDPSLLALGLPPEIRIDQAITDAAALINQATLHNLHVISLVGMAALLPLSFIVGWIIAGRVLRPIDRISAIVRQIGATDLSRRIGLGGPDDELRRMADTFDDMLDRLERSAVAQRRFVEDASHELRNPLATTRTSLDVALADPADTDGLRTAAEVSRRATERMARTVEELLAFTRHEAFQYDSAPLDVSALVLETAQEYRRQRRREGCHDRGDRPERPHRQGRSRGAPARPRQPRRERPAGLAGRHPDHHCGRARTRLDLVRRPRLRAGHRAR